MRRPYVTTSCLCPLTTGGRVHEPNCPFYGGNTCGLCDHVWLPKPCGECGAPHKTKKVCARCGVGADALMDVDELMGGK